MNKPYSYSVKVANRARKSEYTVEKLMFSSKFSSIEELRSVLKSDLQFLPSEFGFVEPGHGLRGKQRWIHAATDIEEMYNRYPGKRDFLFWCFTVLVGEARGTVPKTEGQKQALLLQTKVLMPEKN